MNFDFKTIDWKVVLGAGAFIVALVTLLYFQWWRNRKRLSYEVLSDIVLVSPETHIDEKIEIRYDGQVVKNARLLVIKLINDGYQPIKKDDFEKPIRFVFPNGKPLTAEKVRFDPDNLATEVGRGIDFVQIDPALFNRRDYVQFKAVITNYERMKVDARIVGVSTVDKVKRLSSRVHLIVWIGTVLVTIATTSFLGNVLRIGEFTLKEILIAIAFVVLVVLMGIISRVSEKS